MSENKSKSRYFSIDTVETFTKIARTEGWNQMTSEAWHFVNDHCEWETDDERWHITRVLINDVGYELTKFSRLK